ncbi:MAG: hypothetical protein ACFB50_00170 [Rubrobacteraceae bacterium]
MAKSWDAGQPASFEDRRMWRQLLARLHPDSGGDPELFLFACSVKDQVCKPRRPDKRSTHRRPEPGLFLRSWQDTMGSWATNNRDILRDPRRNRPRNP